MICHQVGLPGTPAPAQEPHGRHWVPPTHGPPRAAHVHVTEHGQGPAVGQVDGVLATRKVPPGEQLLPGRGPGRGSRGLDARAGALGRAGARRRGEEGEAGTPAWGRGALRPGTETQPPRPPSCDGQAPSTWPSHLPGLPPPSLLGTGPPPGIYSSYPGNGCLSLG